MLLASTDDGGAMHRHTHAAGRHARLVHPWVRHRGRREQKPGAYSVGGLPPDTNLTLAVWNATGDGTNSIATRVPTNAAGVARFQLPLHAAFALTTQPVE
jgi:hypothetical protein